MANIDSGVLFNHAALVNQYAGYDGGSFDHNYHWFDSVNDQDTPYDDNGHGSHTMGTILGDDAPPGGGVGTNQIGVAPGARWIGVKAFSAGGTGSTTDIHEAFQWVLAPCDSSGANCDPARAPRIVSNSWGHPDGARTEFLPDVQALRAAGIWPVFSAGNDGTGRRHHRLAGQLCRSLCRGRHRQRRRHRRLFRSRPLAADRRDQAGRQRPRRGRPLGQQRRRLHPARRHQHGLSPRRRRRRAAALCRAGPVPGPDSKNC